MNAIAPGIVDTPMHKPENHESLKHLHPIPRLATVQEFSTPPCSWSELRLSRERCSMSTAVHTRGRVDLCHSK